LTEQLSAAKSGDVMDGVKEINGVKALAAKVDVPDGKALRTLAANTLDKIGSGVLALGAEAKGRALLIVLVTKDLSKTYNANNLIRPIAEAVGGKGGGRPDMAQAGGSDPANLEAALALLYDTMNKMGN
jgi:alanyl-tRNA synthetase